MISVIWFWFAYKALPLRNWRGKKKLAHPLLGFLAHWLWPSLLYIIMGFGPFPHISPTVHSIYHFSCWVSFLFWDNSHAWVRIELEISHTGESFSWLFASCVSVRECCLTVWRPSLCGYMGVRELCRRAVGGVAFRGWNLRSGSNWVCYVLWMKLVLGGTSRNFMVIKPLN